MLAGLEIDIVGREKAAPESCLASLQKTWGKQLAGLDFVNITHVSSKCELLLMIPVNKT